jgi:phosphoribosyl-ATP pyrophosphohydrolase
VKTFDELFDELQGRAEDRPRGSRTVQLLNGGVHAIGKKLVEEAAEAWMASEFESDERAAEELAQLIYHAQVMMVAKGLTLDDIERYL